MLHFSGGPFSHIVALHITEMGALSCLVEHPSLFATGARRIRQKKSTDYFSFLPKYIFCDLSWNQTGNLIVAIPSWWKYEAKP